MKELKTLKELPVCLDLEKNDEWVKSKDLKEEAIKWYKIARDNEFGKGAKAFIEEFFNITEEDLK